MIKTFVKSLLLIFSFVPFAYSMHVKNRAQIASIDVRTSQATTPLHRAARHGQVEIVKKLLEKGCIVDVVNDKKRTPLFSAMQCITRDKREMIQFLIQSGAQLGRFDSYGFTPIHYAASLADAESISILLENGADPEAKSNSNSYGYVHLMPFHILAMLKSPVSDNEKALFEEKRLRCAKVLLAKGASVDAKADFVYTPLQFAVKAGATAFVKFLVERGATGEVWDIGGNGLMHYAASDANTDLIDYFSTKGFDINRKNVAHETPFHIAALKSATNVIEKLAELKAHVSARNRFQETALHAVVNALNPNLASEKKHKDTVLALLSCGVDANALDRSGQTALHKVISLGPNFIILAEILMRKTDLEIKDKKGKKPLECYDPGTLLHSALSKHCDGIAYRLLTNKEQNVNVMCAPKADLPDMGNAPLHLLAKRLYDFPVLSDKEVGITIYELTYCLVRHPRIDFSLKNVDGFTGEEVAQIAGNPIMLASLRNELVRRKKYAWLALRRVGFRAPSDILRLIIAHVTLYRPTGNEIKAIMANVRLLKLINSEVPSDTNLSDYPSR